MQLQGQHITLALIFKVKIINYLKELLPAKYKENRHVNQAKFPKIMKKARQVLYQSTTTRRKLKKSIKMKKKKRV